MESPQQALLLQLLQILADGLAGYAQFLAEPGYGGFLLGNQNFQNLLVTLDGGHKLASEERIGEALFPLSPGKHRCLNIL
ncbi:hypothetical protein D3C75_1176100 [compost metagenome]